MMHELDNVETPSLSKRWMLAEVVFVLLLFFVYAGGATPATNEAHYLARAKHFWNPDWCDRDLFLSSPEAHPVFQFTFGWLTRRFDLPTTAAIGRAVGWLLLAVGWVRLSRAILPQKLMAVLTAAMAVTLWDRMHMAGEWIVGGFEAKVVAFAFVFFALGQAVRAQWGSGTVLAGIATAFHPLVGGWAILALAFSWWFEDSSQSRWQRFRQLLPALIIAALISLLGVLPALGLDRGADRLTHLGARRIYVHWRLGHHLVPFRSIVKGQMSWHFVARHGLLIVVWLAAWRWTRVHDAAKDVARHPAAYACRLAGVRSGRLQRFVLGCVLIALIGAAIEWVTMANWRYQTAWMRYYWYRMSDAMVPVGFSMVAASWIAHGIELRLKSYQLVLAIALLLVSVSLVDNFLDRRRDPRPAADKQGRLHHGTIDEQMAEQRDWLQLCQWCRDSTDEAALFLTPTYFQTFKWYAGRAEVVTWKDVPQGAKGLVEWQDRRRMARRIGLYAEDATVSFEHVQAELTPYDTDYVVVQRRWCDGGNVGWGRPPVFRNASFEVYSLK